MTSPPLLRLRTLCKQFGQVEALKSISMRLDPGRVYGLAGENGAGKSTLVRILCGVHFPDRGDMEFDGKPFQWRNPAEAERAGISVFHQEIPICPSLSVAANVFLGPRMPRRGWFIDRKAMEERCRTLFSHLLGMEIDPRRLMGACSAAERQLALLVRVLSHNARLIILDEPTTALTPPEVRRLFDIIRRLRQQGITFLFVSHLLDELLELSDQIFVLRDGTLVGDLQRGDFDIHLLANLIAGRPLPATQQSRPAPSTTTAMEVRSLSLPGQFSGVSFSLAAGEILGITGLEGSGRAALARALFASPPAQAGEVLIAGNPLRLRNPLDAMRAGIGYLPEDRKNLGLFDDLNIESNLALLRVAVLAKFGLLSAERLRQLTREMREQVQIKMSQSTAPITSLSGGNQQKVLIARWLAIHPKILVMSEPTRGVDIGAKDEICRLIETLAAKGSSFIIASSDLDELIRLADRVLVLNGGSVGAVFFRPAMTKAQLIQATGRGSRRLEVLQ